MLTQKADRIGNTICWFIILWAFVWLCLFAIPGFVDRCSRHETEWAKQTRDMVSVKLSEED